MTKPRSGKVTKPEAIKPKRETFRDSFTVEGPVTIEADFMRCEIGAGDKTCFRTKPGGEIVIERDAPGHIRVISYDKRFVGDRIGKNSIMFMNF